VTGTLWRSQQEVNFTNFFLDTQNIVTAVSKQVTQVKPRFWKVGFIDLASPLRDVKPGNNFNSSLSCTQGIAPNTTEQINCPDPGDLIHLQHLSKCSMILSAILSGMVQFLRKQVYTFQISKNFCRAKEDTARP
jgi:hypothetical protein